MAQNSEKWNKTIQAYKSYIRLEKNLSENSVEAYIRDVTMFENFILRMYDVLPTAVESYMVERYLVHLHSRDHKKSSQARELSGVKSFFNYLLMMDRIESSPAEVISARKSRRTLPDVLTVAEVERIIGSIDTTTVKGRRDRAMLELLYSCGLRVTELISLRIGDLFFGEGYIRVMGKGSKQRLVPIGRVAQEYVMLYLDDRREQLREQDDNPLKTRGEQVLFLSNRKTKLSRVMVFNIIRAATESAGIDKTVSPHTFRHSFATHLIAGGASVRQVQELLGHENITTTEIYTHLDADHLRDAVEKIKL